VTVSQVAASNGQPTAKEKPWQELEEDKRRSESTDVGLKATVAGRVYEFHFGEMSASDVAVLRQQTGHSGLQLLNLLVHAPDVDLVAAVVWMARRLAGEKSLTYEQVADTFMWGSADRLEWVEAVPEAPPEVRDKASGEAVSPPA
jgi:hypothetical protein